MYGIPFGMSTINGTLATKRNNEIMCDNSKKDENTKTDSKPIGNKSVFVLNHILGYIALLSAGFGFAMLLVNFGIFQVDNPNFKPISDFNSLETELKKEKSKMKELRTFIVDSISVSTLILDTDLGQERLGILKEELDRMPFFNPRTATTKGGSLTDDEKSTDLLIAHWHAYRKDTIGHDKSEAILMETLKEVNSTSPNASFLIYSSLLGDSAQIEKLKLQIPQEINRERVMWMEFPYAPNNCQIQEVIHEILTIGKNRIPK